MTPRSEFSRSRGVQLIVRALHQLDIPASENERHDILINNRKVSGSAFKIINDKAYHHGTMMIESDLGLLKRYLAKDSALQRKIEGRGVESVASPVTRLCNHSLTITHFAFVEAVVDEFVRTFGTDLVGWSGLEYETNSNKTKSGIELRILDKAFVEEHVNVVENAELLKVSLSGYWILDTNRRPTTHRHGIGHLVRRLSLHIHYRNYTYLMIHYRLLSLLTMG